MHECFIYLEIYSSELLVVQATMAYNVPILSENYVEFLTPKIVGM